MIGLNDFDYTTEKQIRELARATGKDIEAVLRDLVKTGLTTYKTSHKSAAKALLEISDFAKKIRATGPKDLSSNHDTYQWDE